MKRLTRVNSIYFILIALLAIFLNQSMVINKANLSFSDFVCVLLVFVLIVMRRFTLPYAPLMFFLFISCWVLSVGVFYVPNKLPFLNKMPNFIIEYIKLFMCFIYFAIGYNITKMKNMHKFLLFFAWTAFIVGLFGIIVYLLPENALRNIMYFGGYRLKGLMNDPNYFSILQILAFVYFSRIDMKKNIYKFAVLTVLIISILFSGSKTGVVVLLCYVGLLFLEYLLKFRYKIKTLFWGCLFVLCFFIFAKFSWIYSNYLLNFMPSLERIVHLITNFGRAIEEGGSARTLCWNIAIDLIEEFPITGVGLGNYTVTADLFSGIALLAHNTYLQMFAEWGLLWASVFFIYIIWVILRITLSMKRDKINIILRDMLIVFLLAFMGISLNNARIFWICLGMSSFIILGISKSETDIFNEQ